MEIIITIILTPFAFYFLYWMVAEGDNIKIAYERSNCSLAPALDHSAFDAILQETPLTENELRAVKILSKARGGGIYGISIRSTVYEGDRAAIRQLIKDLQEQAADAPKELIGIIGIHAYSAVVACKESHNN